MSGAPAAAASATPNRRAVLDYELSRLVIWSEWLGPVRGARITAELDRGYESWAMWLEDGALHGKPGSQCLHEGQLLGPRAAGILG